MATGMEMLLKTFGIDPDHIKKEMADFGKLVLDIHARLVRIEANQRILADALKVELPHAERNPGDPDTPGNGATGHAVAEG
jgi:hypothetical protein